MNKSLLQYKLSKTKPGDRIYVNGYNRAFKVKENELRNITAKLLNGNNITTIIIDKLEMIVKLAVNDKSGTTKDATDLIVGVNNG